MTGAIYAYLAGAIDSDGSITMKRSTYHMRVRKDAKNPVYSERILLKQVTPDIPEFLQETFGGSLRTTKGQTPNSKPLYSFECRDLQAAALCRQLLPYLRVKRKQAEINLELRESKKGKYKQASYWFKIKHPNWRNMELVTTEEASNLLGYANIYSVSQAVRSKTLLAIPGKRGQHMPRIPRKLIEYILDIGGTSVRPPELVNWQESLYQSIRELNKIGISGTKIYRREGYHKNKGLE